MKPIIIIPARMAAMRLPNKPLADINGLPMIAHVAKRAIEAGIAPVYVASDGDEIREAVKKVGAEAIITDPALPSGTDRVYAAFKKLGRNDFDVIINVQGDLPLIDPKIIKDTLKPLENKDVDIATPVAEMSDENDASNPNIVKAVLSFGDNKKIARALYFTRANAPHGSKIWYHHIGVYAYRVLALQKFVSLKPSPLELLERLEQLRALEANMRIDAVVVDSIPQSVDTSEDLEKVRNHV